MSKKRQMVCAFWCVLHTPIASPANMFQIVHNFAKFHNIFHGNVQSFLYFISLVQPFPPPPHLKRMDPPMSQQSKKLPSVRWSARHEAQSVVLGVVVEFGQIVDADNKWRELYEAISPTRRAALGGTREWHSSRAPLTFTLPVPDQCRIGAGSVPDRSHIQAWSSPTHPLQTRVLALAHPLAY